MTSSSTFSLSEAQQLVREYRHADPFQLCSALKETLNQLEVTPEAAELYTHMMGVADDPFRYTIVTYAQWLEKACDMLSLQQ